MCPPLVNIANLRGQASLPNLRDFLISSIIPPGKPFMQKSNTQLQSARGREGGLAPAGSLCAPLQNHLLLLQALDVCRLDKERVG